MAEGSSRKIPVTERQFLWVQDDDKGEVTLHVGPTMVSPTAADRIVRDDGRGGFKDLPAPWDSNTPQKMVEVGDGQYAVLFNPLAEADGGPNGKFKQGRNEGRPLRNGTRAMIPGPCSFYLRPGQRCEVRDAHALGADQYILVKVYGPVDKNAPYYDVTARSASIKKASDKPLGGEPPAAQAEPLTQGQLVVIRGIDTQFYIPPTGVDVEPDVSVDDSGKAIDSTSARLLVEQARQKSRGPAPELYASTEGAARSSQTKGLALGGDTGPLMGARFSSHAPTQRQPEALLEAAGISADEVGRNAVLRDELTRRAEAARLVRQAAVLAEKEFCVIVTSDGAREIHIGPARVFPGPYDRFQTAGSDGRTYYAYEMLPQRALWIRVVARIDRKALQDKLPNGVKLEPPEKTEFVPGDELLITGVSGFFFPFNEIEVLSPDPANFGAAVVGNDHSRVFIEAVGIDQKSGIYVRDLKTGEVRLVRGKQSYLVDPRREARVQRVVPSKLWNLWVAEGEPHKAVQPGSPAVTTPWALSVTIPHQAAVLVTSASGRRVVEGPGVALLEYDEALVAMRLSTGKPKTTDRLLETCFLRPRDNRVTDVIPLQTGDFVVVEVKIVLHVTFEEAAREKWFNSDNYVKILTDRVRSLLRREARSKSLSELWPQTTRLVRDTVLGPKPEGGGKRAGLRFDEIGMVVTELEVLTQEIKDPAIAALMQSVQRESVTLAIGDRQAQETLASAKLRDDLAKNQAELDGAAARRGAELLQLKSRLSQEADLAGLAAEGELRRRRFDLERGLATAESAAKIERGKAEAEAAAALRVSGAEAQARAAEALHAEERSHAQKMRELEILLIDAQSRATVAERQSVQPHLVEALTALGDKALLASAAENMNLVSLFRGKDVGQILEAVFGAGFKPALEAALSRKGAADRQAEPTK